MKISQLAAVCLKTNGRCFYCNGPADTIDHFVSRQKWREWLLVEYLGSADQPQNLFLACRSCNSQKGTKPPDLFIGSSHKAWSRYERANNRVATLLV